QVQDVRVEMQDIEFVRPRPHITQHDEVGAEIAFEWRLIESDRLGTTRHELGRGHRIAGRKKRHVVAERDERIGEIGNDTLCSAVETRRDRLEQWRHLRDTKPPDRPASGEANDVVEVGSFNHKDASGHDSGISQLAALPIYKMHPWARGRYRV